MQPEQPQPVPFAPAVDGVQPLATKNRKRTILALWLLIAPTAVFIVAPTLYAATNLLFSGTASVGLFDPQNVVQTGINVSLFIAGVIAFLAWLPGLIIGIVLLATKKK